MIVNPVRCLVIGSLFAIATLFSLPASAASEAAEQKTQQLAIVDFAYVDTSGEPEDQALKHESQMTRFMAGLRAHLSSDRQLAVRLDCDGAPCTLERNEIVRIQRAAQATGARLLLVGGIHKLSTLVQWAKITVIDLKKNEVLVDKLLSFRGDTDAAWERLETFVVKEVTGITDGHAVNAESLPVKLAVFDYELLDVSGGAGVIPESEDDRKFLADAAAETRRLAARSGRYDIVELGKPEQGPVAQHKLHDCDGCDAAIARQLGADQSLLGIVTRITRTDYAVTYKLRDARTGKVIDVEQTDLRIGANYSWSRGAAWLIENRLLSKPMVP